MPIFDLRPSPIEREYSKSRTTMTDGFRGLRAVRKGWDGPAVAESPRSVQGDGRPETVHACHK
jgi:hypothetical protein